MEAIRAPKVKICCIQSKEEARMAIGAGASFIGLVSRMPSGPGPIPEERIRQIATAVAGQVTTMLLTSLQDAPTIIAQARRLAVGGLQLVDAVPHEDLRRIRTALPHLHLLQVIHVSDSRSIDEALNVQGLVDGVLLDSGKPELAVKQLGGTGRVHDWSVSRRIREMLEIPVWLAGGLSPENVAQAVAEVGPACIDVCSGLRPHGKLDAVKLTAFMDAIRRS